eukprot:NODE_1159_length_1970_cov_0.708177.p5 type:complete len:103 gc:universal NODE_1159_length_1970_cov_0.708177:438-130(-)
MLITWRWRRYIWRSLWRLCRRSTLLRLRPIWTLWSWRGCRTVIWFRFIGLICITFLVRCCFCFCRFLLFVCWWWGRFCFCWFVFLVCWRWSWFCRGVFVICG